MKRFFSMILAIMLFTTCCSSTVLAANDIEPYASLTLSYYYVELSAGDSRGTLYIDFNVTSNKLADSIGVEEIKVYKSNGTLVSTIAGTTSNGLIRNNYNIHNSAYKYKGTSGTSYYAEVTIFATVGSDSDSRTITTSTEEAP